jgi:hypothetical protein
MTNYRETILKKFFNRIKESKRNNLKEVRIPMKEFEDLGAVVHEMLVEFYNEKMSDEHDESESIELSGGTF